MTKFLQEGDVIELKDGMTVYAEIPERFRYGGSTFSKSTTVTEVVVGKEYRVPHPNENLTTALMVDFAHYGVLISRSKIRDFVEDFLPEIKDEVFCLQPGKFVVYKTSYEGGSSGGGMNGHDSYPDGHRVFCESTIEPEIKVNFYQSGSFTAMIVDIKPIAKMSKVWIEEK